MPFRVSFFSQQQSTKLGGWTNNFWNSSSDLTTTLTKALALRPLIDAVQGNQAWVQSIRISDTTTFRQVLNKVITGNGPSTVTAARDADYPNTALLLKLRANPNYVVNNWFKGIPDSVTRQSGTFQPTPAFTLRLNTLFAALTSGSNGWALWALDKTRPTRHISAISQIGVVTAPSHGFNTFDKIRISRAKGLTQANALWEVVRIDADNFSLVGWVQPTIAIPYLGKGIARAQTYTAIQLAAIDEPTVTSHKTGRPTNLLGGRRRRRAS